MSVKKSGILIVVISIFVITTFFTFSVRNLSPEKALKKFTKEIKKGNLANMSLTIYYLPPFSFTPFALSTKDLINNTIANKYIINGGELESNIELFKQMSSIELINVEKKSHANVRIYYVFKNDKGKKILDVAMWSVTGSIFINDYEFKENDIFYDILIYFLPEDKTKELKIYLNRE